jgi:S1-C subfamily serine protease
VFTQGGCCGTARADAPHVPTLDREAATVGVITECGYGSGVLIDETHVFTAHHVIDCENTDAKVRLAERVHIVTIDGRTIDAAYDALDPARDLARLRLAVPVKGAATLTIGKPSLGALECMTTAAPERNLVCSEFTSRDGDRQMGDIILGYASVWFGNSGSPLWDDHDQLIGLVVRLMWCTDFDEKMWRVFGIRTGSCGGRASTLEGVVLL